jgi:hypothetical protein
MDTSFCKEQPKKQEDVARRKKVKEKRQEAGSENSSTDHSKAYFLVQLCISFSSFVL